MRFDSDMSFEDYVREDLREIKESIQRIEKAVFIGNGEPSLLSRMATVETTAKAYGGTEDTKRKKALIETGGISAVVAGVVFGILSYIAGVRQP
jgi:activator of 2-hydroxyglutaryl-CoA dehydratase